MRFKQTTHVSSCISIMYMRGHKRRYNDQKETNSIKNDLQSAIHKTTD